MDEQTQLLLDAVREEMKGFVDSEISPLRKKLLSLEELDTAPNDEKVKDLEKRLDDAEADLKSWQEKARLLEAGAAAATRTTEQKDAALFKGAFLKDAEGLREAMRGAPQGDVRAIDTSLFSGGGQLAIETADRFLDYVVDLNATLQRVQTRRMNSDTAAIDRLTLSTRQLRPATEGSAPTPSDAVATARRTLDVNEVIWAEDITLSFLEDNIEKAGAEQHIARLLATGFSNDLNDLGWNGLASSGDAFLTIDDGWAVLMRADGEVNDTDLSSGVTTAKDCLNASLRDMPVQYRAFPGLTYFAPVGFCQTYADEFADRETSAGDGVFVNGFPSLRYFGIPVVPEPHLAEGDAGIETDDALMLTPAQNLIVGLHRSMRVDSEWVPRKRQVEYTLSARVDVNYAWGGIVVLGSAIPSGLL